MSNNPLTMEQLIRDAINRLNLYEIDEWAVHAQAVALLEHDARYDVPREKRSFTNAFLRAFHARPFVVTTSWDDVPGSDGDATS